VAQDRPDGNGNGKVNHRVEGVKKALAAINA